MSGLWDTLKDKAKQVGNAASLASQRTRVTAEIALIDRQIRSRQQTFGVDLYNYVAPKTQNPEFWASDDPLTSTIRPPLLVAQREIAALEIKRRQIAEDMDEMTVRRTKAFPTPAVDWKEKVVNAGKATAMGASDTALKTEMALLDRQITSHKHTFGTELFATLEELEDTKGWVPTDREVRSIYDQCRKDVESTRKKRGAKQEQLTELGGGIVPDPRYKRSNSQKQLPASSLAVIPSSRPNNTSSDVGGGGGMGFSPPAPVMSPAPLPITTTTTVTTATTTVGGNHHQSMGLSPVGAQPPPPPQQQPPPMAGDPFGIFAGTGQNGTTPPAPRPPMYGTSATASGSSVGITGMSSSSQTSGYAAPRPPPPPQQQQQQQGGGNLLNFDPLM